MRSFITVLIIILFSPVVSLAIENDSEEKIIQDLTALSEQYKTGKIIPERMIWEVESLSLRQKNIADSKTQKAKEKYISNPSQGRYRFIGKCDLKCELANKLYHFKKIVQKKRGDIEH